MRETQDRPEAAVEALKELQEVRRQYDLARAALVKATKDLVAVEARVAVMNYRTERTDG